MYTDQQPPSIQFYEEASLSATTSGKKGLTKIVRLLSFGLIKTDTQAGILIVLLTVGALVITYLFIGAARAIEPTTTFEIIPQESIGSIRGLPPKTDIYDQ